MAKEYFELDRKRFEIASEWAKSKGIVAQVSKIRSRVKLQNGQGRYEFPIVSENRSGDFGNIYLKRNDLFVPFGVGLYVQFDLQTNPTGKTPLYSYPIKATAANAGFLGSDIEALYNGQLLMRLNQTQANESFPLEDFRIVPETQPVTVYNGTTSVGAGIEAQFSIRETLKRFVPDLKLQGNFDTRLEIDFNGTGSDFSLADAGGTTASTTIDAYLVLYMEGVLLKNFAEEGVVNPLS